jgi:pilus assembly protein FimV
MAIDRNTVIREAQKLAGKGQFDKAIAEWRKLVKEDPSDTTALNTIGDLCLKKNAKSEAVDAYKRAADILAADGFASKAIALYKKILNIDMSQIDVHLALGDMHAEKGLTGNALENYKYVADHYKKQNNTGKALGIYQKMADLNPSNIAFRVKLAAMYAKERMLPEAIRSYLDAADVHVEKGEFQEARQMFEKVLELDQDNTSVYHKAGIVYFKEGKIDEARKSLKRAVEANPGNDELLNLYLEVLVKAGRATEMEEVYRKLLATEPGRFDLHEKLYGVLIAKEDYEKALGEAVAIAEHRAESMDFEGAAEILKNLMTVTHDPPEVASALAEIFKRMGRAREGAAELIDVSDALISRGSRDDAREVLNRALLLAPGLQEALEKLASIGETSAEAEVASESSDLAEPEQGEEISPPLFGEDPPLPPPQMGAAPAAGELEDPFVASALAEVEVLLKYGLADKAIEQLESIVEKRPDHLKVRAQLLDLYRGQKKKDKAVLQALTLAELLEARGDSGESQEVLHAALELAPDSAQIMAKLGIEHAEPETPEVVEPLEEPELLEPLATTEADEVPELAVPSLSIDIPQAVEGELQVPEISEEFESPAAEETAEFIEQAEEPSAEEVAEFEESVEEGPVPAASSQRTAGPAADLEEDVPIEQEVESSRKPVEETELMEIWAEAEFYYQQGLFDEARKHYEKYLELRPEDEKAMARIVEISGENDEIAEFSRLAETVEGLESLVGTHSEGGEVVTETDVHSVRSLMEDISSLRNERTAANPGKNGGGDPSQLGSVDETSFADVKQELGGGNAPSHFSQDDETSFADVDRELSSGKAPSRFEPTDESSFAGMSQELAGGDETFPSHEQDSPSAEFFDLAAELRDELSSSIKEPVTSQEQSLDEIFDEFKKGVEAHEKKEEENTHYNLGVAYREMGLLDDAIAEFNMTTEGEHKFIQSRYLLGLCYLEKGDFETAITEIQNALGYSYSFGEASEERTGMHYDLGLAYQGTGNVQGALEEFQKVHNIDSSYREVTIKIQELQEGDFISLDSIKEDIEKEISFKFLEEGARIEREEKTKKTKK